MIKVAQFSDLHFSGKNLDEAGRCFGFGVDQAIERGLDVAVISGDSTDHALDVHSPAVERLAREGRMPLARACFDFLPHRALLDLAGWAEVDIFAHV